MKYLIPLFLFVIGSCSLKQDWSNEDVAIWNICGRPSFSENSTEYQRQSILSHTKIPDEKISFIGKVVDVRANEMDGVYIVLETPYIKEKSITTVYAFVPPNYPRRPFPEELMKKDIVRVRGKYIAYCNVVENRYLHDIAIDSFDSIPR